MDEPERGFLIDGNVLPIPTWPSFTTDEWLVLYEYTELTAVEFLTAEALQLAGEDEDPEIARKMNHPGLMTALMNIAYQRANPGLKQQKVKELIGAANYLDALETVFPAEAGEAPKDSASTSKPNESLPNGLDDSTKSSGADSPNGSGAPGSSPASTGTTRSATSSLVSVPETSAA